MNILYIAPCYEYHPVLVDTLLTNTTNNWEIIVVHDGEPSHEWLRSFRERYSHQSKIHVCWFGERVNDWGHTLRAKVVEELISGNTSLFNLQCKDYGAICHTNCDNFVTPEHSLRVSNALENNPDAIACTHPIAHNYFQWGYFHPGLEFGQIDCCQITVRKEYALEIGWPSREHAADWIYIFKLIEKYGRNRVVPVPGNPILAIHN